MLSKNLLEEDSVEGAVDALRSEKPEERIRMEGRKLRFCTFLRRPDMEERPRRVPQKRPHSLPTFLMVAPPNTFTGVLLQEISISGPPIGGLPLPNWQCT